MVSSNERKEFISHFIIKILLAINNGERVCLLFYY